MLWLEAPRISGPRRATGIAAFAVLAQLSQTSFLLAPAVLPLALTTWRRERPYAIGLLCAMAFQTTVRMLAFPGHVRTAQDVTAIPHIFVSKLLLWPLLGHQVADAYGSWARRLEEGALAATAAGAAVGVIALVAVHAAFSRRDATTGVLLATWLTSASTYLLFGLDIGRGHLPVYNGGRYAFLPSMLLFLLLAHQLAEQKRSRWLRLSYGVALVAAILVGLSEYRYPPWLAKVMEGEPWRAEVQRFRDDPRYDHLRIAPEGWDVAVPRDAR